MNRFLSNLASLLFVAAFLAACGSPAATAPTAAEVPAEEGAPESQIAAVDMTNLQTYTYKTNLFSIDIPASWSVDDRGSSIEALVRFTDASENGVILVDLFQENSPQTEDALTKLLQDYLQQTYEIQPNFSQDAPILQSDGSILIVWGYDATLSDGSTMRLLGNTFIKQRDDKISVLTIALPDEQFDGLMESVNAILNSYKIDPYAALQ